MPRKKTFAQHAAKLPDVQLFPKIAYSSFAYSGDEEALRALRAVPGVPQLFEWIYEHVADEYWRLLNIYNNVQVTEDNYPTLLAMLRRSCQALDLPVPDLYISYSPVYNAFTSGIKQPFIVLNSTLVEQFSAGEVCHVIGHELGHIKGRHVLYSSVGQFIIQFLPVLQSLIPLNIGLIQMPLLIALYEWMRRAEMSCDRAGMLCVQDEELSLGAQAKFCGKLANLPEELNLEQLAKQYHTAQDSDNAVAKVLLMLSGIWTTHPAGVARLYRLRQFIHGDKYRRILAGDYDREK